MNSSTICAATNVACTYQFLQVHSEVVWKKLGETPFLLKPRVCGTSRLAVRLGVFGSSVREHRLTYNKQQVQRGSSRRSFTVHPQARNSNKRKCTCCSSQPGHSPETENGSGRVKPSSSGDTAEEIVGVVIVDHGSRRAESNQLLDAFVTVYKAHSGRSIVEAAHMEIARPSIADAFDKVVEQGANVVVISPYFLSPGRHWFQDIPELAAEASEKHPGVKYLVTAPIGLHPLMSEIIEGRIQHCLKHAAGNAEECDVCRGSGRCKMVTAVNVELDTVVR